MYYLLYIFILFDFHLILLKIIEISWILLILLTAILFLYYGYNMTKLLFETAQHVSNNDNINKKYNSLDKNIAMKFLRISLYISIYLSINPYII